jgi:hypothetical protein
VRGLARAGAALARSGGLRTAAGRGLDLVTQVGDTAAEVVRSRRDPALVAERRRVAARRRLVLWSLATLLLAAFGATELVDVIGGDVTAASVGVLVLVFGLLLYCLIGVAKAGIDLIARTRVVRRLPAPQPQRRAVAPTIRPLFARLDGYSDALRQVTGTIGVAADDSDMRGLRDRTLSAADAAEVRLRGRAAELTAMLRGGKPPAGSPVAATCAQLKQQIAAGVDQYGRLVAAASEAASASSDLAERVAPIGGLGDATEQLNALAAGMREITDAATPRP